MTITKSRYLPFILAQRKPPNPFYNENFTSHKVLEKKSKPVTYDWVPESAEQEPQVGIPKQRNPFLIENVLLCIFPYLDQPSLLACRGVSRLWRELANSFVYDKSKISLYGPMEDEAGQAFLDTMTREGNTDLPMGEVHYQMSYYGFFVNSSHFFTKFGHAINKLHLDIYPFEQAVGPTGTNRFVHIFSFMLTSVCENLEELTLSNLDQLCYDEPLVSCADHKTHFQFTHQCMGKLTLSASKSWNFSSPRDKQGANFLRFLRKLIPVFPNLMSLTTDFRPEQSRNMIPFMRSLRIALHSMRIEELIFKGNAMDWRATRHLRKMNLTHLRKIELSVSGDPEDRTNLGSFQLFLESVAETLERLVILEDPNSAYDYSKRLSPFLEFAPPRMPELEEFEMRNYNGLRLNGFAFFRRMPKLRHFIVVDMTPPVEDFMTKYNTLHVLSEISLAIDGKWVWRMQKESFPKMKVLKLKTIIAPNSECLDDFDIFMDAFTCLKRVELDLSFVHKNVQIGRVLKAVSSSASRLKELCITFHHCHELRDEVVVNHFLQVLSSISQDFKELRNLHIILADLPSMARVILPLEVMEGMLGNGKGSLNYLHLEGFMIGRTEEETQQCETLMDSCLSQWSVRERGQSQS